MTPANDKKSLSEPVTHSEQQLKAFIAKRHVTRDQIAEFMGIRTKFLSELAFKKRITLPSPQRKNSSTYIYDAKQIVDWIKTKPLDRANRLENNSRPKPAPQLDNAMASAFLRTQPIDDKPKTMTDLAKKYSRSRAKTTVVHLQERNDYVPPHSGLNRATGQGEGYYSHYQGNIIY